MGRAAWHRRRCTDHADTIEEGGMDVLATYPRRLTTLVLLSAILGLRAPIACLNTWRAEQEIMARHRAWAASEYSRAMLLTPNDEETLVAAAAVYGSLGRHQEAVETYRRAAAAGPTATEPMYLLALELQRAGDPAGAATALREAVHRNPGEARSWRLLATVYRLEGRSADSVSAWRGFEARFPQYKAEAEANITRLERTKP
jgi:tetratricopeptide (TPR) repeat protein